MVINIASYLRDAKKADTDEMSESWVGTSISPPVSVP